MQVFIKDLDETLRYNDLVDTYGGWGMVFFVEEHIYMFDGSQRYRNIPGVWLVDHNIENYQPRRITTIDSRHASRAMARIIAAVNPKMAKRMGDTVKDALRAEGFRADVLIKVVDREDTVMSVNGPREEAA